MLYFKHMSGSDSHFPKSEVLPVYLALQISCACMTCFMVLWGWSSLISSSWSYTSSKTFSSWFWNVLRTIWGYRWLLFFLMICY